MLDRAVEGSERRQVCPKYACRKLTRCGSGSPDSVVIQRPRTTAEQQRDATTANTASDDEPSVTVPSHRRLFRKRAFGVWAEVTDA